MDTSDQIPVVVSGANGKMGREVVNALLQQVDMRLVAALGHTRGVGVDIGTTVTGEPCGIVVTNDMEAAMQAASGGVLVDFTLGQAVKEIVLCALHHNVACVVGTTAIPQAEIAEIDEASKLANAPVLLAPNFALGAVLMMKFAKDIEAVLKKAGADMEAVVKTTCFLTDMENFAAFNEIYGKHFISKPARSCVSVLALPAGALCEVEVIAHVK